MSNCIKIILRGVGQVMLQNNALTGLLFLAGIFYNSWLMGLGAIAGNIISTISAKFLKYSDEDIKNGLYGFNGTLVGIAIWFFFEVNIYTVIAIIIGAVLSTVIMQTMKKRMPAFTAPFVIATCYPSP
ncbi:MAG: urea transporter [Patescibacteria group bacterium]|jgi:urea transporter